MSLDFFLKCATISLSDIAFHFLKHFAPLYRMEVRPMSEKLTQGNRSVEKALRIIEAMARYQQPMRLHDIAVACEMSPSTALRMITTLQNCGYVQQDRDTTRYFLTIKICHLGNLVSQQVSIRNTCRPALVELAEKTGEYVTIAIEREMTLLYIDDVNAVPRHTSLRVSESLGRTAMLHNTGIGKLFLSTYDEKQLDDYIAKFGLPRKTLNTITTKEALVRELERIRENGYSTDNEESEVGVRSIAAPITDWHGNYIAGISIAAPTPLYTADAFLELVPTLMEAARQISDTYFRD